MIVNDIKMTPYEKQFWVAYHLNAMFINLPSNSVIPISADEFDFLPEDEAINILKKFAVDYEMIYMFPDPNQLEKWVDVDLGDGKMVKGCAIRKLPNFDKSLIELYFAMQEIVEGRKQKADEENNKVIYSLSYTGRHLLINDEYVLVKTNYDSINARLLEYLFENQNRTITRKEFEEKGVLRKEKNEDKNFYTFLDDIKIKGYLRDLFFSTDLGVHTLHLKNPIREKDLQGKDIKILDLDKIAKRLIQN